MDTSAKTAGPRWPSSAHSLEHAAAADPNGVVLYFESKPEADNFLDWITGASCRAPAPTLQSERDYLLAAVKKVVSHNGWSATEIRDVVALIARCDERDAREKEPG